MAHILVIEDDAAFRRMLEQLLQADGHRVSSAIDGRAALTALQHLRPDLVITDIMMPNLDGIATIVQLSRLHSGLPVIAMSGGRRALSAEFNLESAALLGVQATLSKPFTRQEMQRAILDALA